MNFDEELLVWIQSVCVNDFLTPIFKFITFLGNNGWIWIALAVVLMIFKKTRTIGIMVTFALIGSLIVNNIALKNIVMRTRPYEVVSGVERLISAQSDYSFPSGHAGVSFSAAIAVMKGIKRFEFKGAYIVLYYGVLILAILIAFSRLYLGVHYPTDVAVGILSGWIIGNLVWKIPMKNNKLK
jgi:undecaprenyl-diphosphatase